MSLTVMLTQLSLNTGWARRRGRKESAVIAPAHSLFSASSLDLPQEEEVGLLPVTWPLLLDLGPPHFPLVTQPFLLRLHHPPSGPCCKQADLVDMAKSMHREKFGTQVNYLFQWEKDAALNAIQTGETRQLSVERPMAIPLSNRI